jgi:hypothetical protein
VFVKAPNKKKDLIFPTSKIPCPLVCFLFMEKKCPPPPHASRILPELVLDLVVLQQEIKEIAL